MGSSVPSPRLSIPAARLSAPGRYLCSHLRPLDASLLAVSASASQLQTAALLQPNASGSANRQNVPHTCTKAASDTRIRGKARPAAGNSPRDRMARVQVSDEIWMSFRAGLGATPVNVALGELVERAVGRHQRRVANDPESIGVAVEDARAVAAELQALIARLEEVAKPKGNAISHDHGGEGGPSSDAEQTRLEGV